MRRRIIRRSSRRAPRRNQRRSTGRKQYLLYKEQARIIITERVKHFSEQYQQSLQGLKVGRIAIRNQGSRWGSCSRNGNLNFNYKIAFLTPELRDYVIVHEICHIKEFNHGRGFWDLVGKTTPNYLELRRKLRAIEHAVLAELDLATSGNDFAEVVTNVDVTIDAKFEQNVFVIR